LERCKSNYTSISNEISLVVVSISKTCLAATNQFAFLAVLAERNILEDRKTGCIEGVSIDIKSLGSVDVLEHTHRCVLHVIFHHIAVALALIHTQRGVLKNAPVTKCALFGTINEVLAN
jgi:hypothetical protein